MARLVSLPVSETMVSSSSVAMIKGIPSQTAITSSSSFSSSTDSVELVGFSSSSKAAASASSLAAASAASLAAYSAASSALFSSQAVHLTSS